MRAQVFVVRYGIVQESGNHLIANPLNVFFFEGGVFIGSDWNGKGMNPIRRNNVVDVNGVR